MEDLVDRIYEAAFVPDEWERVLQEASDLSGSASGQVFLFDAAASPKGRCMENVRPLFDEFIKGDTWKFCESVQSMCSLQPASFVHVDDFLTAEQIENDPARIQLRKFGIGSHVCTAIPMPSGELVTFVFQRWLKDGAFDGAAIAGLDRLRPHLARAGLMAARLGMEHAHTTVSTLKALGLPAAVLSAAGKVLTTNALLEEMPSVFVPTAGGRMALADTHADSLFQKAVADVRTAEPGVLSIPLPQPEGRQPLVIHVLPLRRTAHDIFSGADVLVAATAFSPSTVVPSVSLLNALFDLTPAEARLASGLVLGQSVKETAAERGITYNTARKYLERIFNKTGTHHQGQLVALLSSTAVKIVSPIPARRGNSHTPKEH